MIPRMAIVTVQHLYPFLLRLALGCPSLDGGVEAGEGAKQLARPEV